MIKNILVALSIVLSVALISEAQLVVNHEVPNPIDATYITQIANATLTNEQALSGLSSGIMRVATTTGVVTSLTDSAGIAANISDETGTNVLVFNTSPTLITPVLGVAAGTNITSKFTSSGSGLAVANVGANSCGTSAASIAGNDNSGEVTVGATSGTQCRITFSAAAPNRWDCTSSDNSTAVLTRVAYVDTTHADILGLFTAGDVITYVCFPR